MLPDAPNPEEVSPASPSPAALRGHRPPHGLLSGKRSSPLLRPREDGPAAAPGSGRSPGLKRASRRPALEFHAEEAGTMASSWWDAGAACAHRPTPLAGRDWQERRHVDAEPSGEAAGPGRLRLAYPRTYQLSKPINTPFLLKPLEDWLSTARVKRVLTHQVPDLVPLCGLASLNSAQPRWSPFLDTPGEFSSGVFTDPPPCLQIVPIT